MQRSKEEEATLAGTCACIPGMMLQTFSEKTDLPDPEGPASPTCDRNSITIITPGAAGHMLPHIASNTACGVCQLLCILHHIFAPRSRAHHNNAFVLLSQRLNCSDEYIEALHIRMGTTASGQPR